MKYIHKILPETEEMSVLIIGGKGYIGSHVAEVLRSKDITTYIIDVDNCDILDYGALDCYISNISNCQYVIHMAALKSVSESILFPDLYHQVNVEGTRNVIKAMLKHNIPNIIFSSSATVYNDATSEDSNLIAINPYGETKILAEREIINSGLNYAILRYFNPIGMFHNLGEKITSPNLFTSCIRSYKHNLPITIYGDCVRDYVFVGDLAQFHHTLIESQFDHLILNFGTGNGMTTKQFLEYFENTNNIILEKNFVPQRDGDKYSCVADVTKFKLMYPNFQFTPIDRWFLID